MESLLKLREFREKAGLNQREIALRFNMSQTNYCNRENGRSQANAKQIIDFCEFFNCTPNDLFGFRGVHTIVAANLDQED